MKLYEVPNSSKIRVIGDIKTPVDSPDIQENEELKFIKIDGMYSLCKNSKGDYVYLVAWAEVEVLP